MLSGLLDIIFPPHCLTCDTQVSAYGTLCKPCWKHIQFITDPVCAACGLPFDYDIGKNALCGKCLKEQPSFAQARSAIHYDQYSSPLVLKLKYADQTQLANIYGPWLARCGKELIKASELIVPVPLHYWRFIKRRYNQSALLAHALAKQTGLEVIPDALIRTRHTPPQTQLPKAKRNQNVKGAFSAHKRHTLALKEKHILLVDDVMTTTATAHHCSKALLKAGAKQVNVLTLARATVQ